MLVPKPKPKTLNIALRKQGKGGKKVTSFVDCPEAGQSVFTISARGLVGRTNFFSQVQQMCTLGTRGFSPVQRKFSVLAEAKDLKSLWHPG